jgi:hypothetical protein
MDPKEEWEKFLRGELPPGQIPISPWHNEMIRQIQQKAYRQAVAEERAEHDRLKAEFQARQEAKWVRFVFEDAHLRATSSFTRAMSDKMLADCLSSNRAK